MTHEIIHTDCLNLLRKIWSAWTWSRELRRRGFGWRDSLEISWLIENRIAWQAKEEGRTK